MRCGCGWEKRRDAIAGLRDWARAIDWHNHVHLDNPGAHTHRISSTFLIDLIYAEYCIESLSCGNLVTSYCDQSTCFHTAGKRERRLQRNIRLVSATCSHRGLWCLPSYHEELRLGSDS
jgi:hypothetical protein